MKNEQLLKDIEEQIKKNRTRMYYGNICRSDLMENQDLLGRIKTVLKCADNDYERGCEDAWELARKIVGDTNAYTLGQLSDIFDNLLIEDIFDGHTYQEALAKVEAYEKKKKEEEEEPVVGDVVKVFHNSAVEGFMGIGIFTGEDELGYFVMNDDGRSSVYLKDRTFIVKTNKHYDIREMLDYIAKKETCDEKNN